MNETKGNEMSDDGCRTMDDALSRTLERMNGLAKQVADAQARIQAKIDTDGVTCPFHDKPCSADMRSSVKATMDSGETVVVPGRCSTCEAEIANANAEKALKLCGVSDDILHCTIEDWEAGSEADRKTKELAIAYCSCFKGVFILMGPVGVGKSHLAVGMIRRFLATGPFLPRPIFITNGQLMARVSERYNDQRASDIVKACERTPLLVLDELGVSRGGSDEWPTINRILCERYACKRPTIITTNLDYQQFKGFIGDRLDDRVRQSAFAMCVIGGASRRGCQRASYLGM